MTINKRSLEEELYLHASINEINLLSTYQLKELLSELKYQITLKDYQSTSIDVNKLQLFKEDLSHLSRETVISLIQLIIHNIY